MKLQSSLLVLSIILTCWTRNSVASCQYDIVESMPDGLGLSNPSGVNIIKTHKSLIDLVESASKELKIASFYWYLTAPGDFFNNSAAIPGRDLMRAITNAVSRGVRLEVLLDGSSAKDMNNQDDIQALNNLGTVKRINMTRLLHGGVMHTKFMIVDSKAFYMGSSNFDWRSYTEIKEMGFTFKDCSVLASDLDKVFRAYMLMADASELPQTLPDELKTSINMQNPLSLKLDSTDSDEARLFLGASPPAFNGREDFTGRTDDIDGLLYLINSARHYISISVMNYSPRMEFVWPKRYWPRIDDALRQAATTRRVRVQLLFSNWSSTRPSEIAWYKSLDAIKSSDFKEGEISVKLFKVPAFDDYQRRIPYARVKHDKYMVTDKGVYLGTSNWTPDYFVNTAGVSLVIQPALNATNKDLHVIKSFQKIFERDFNSQYSHSLA